MTPERRDAPRRGWRASTRGVYRAAIREVCWTVDLDDNETGDPSLLKVMSMAFAVAAVHGLFMHETALTWVDVAMAFLAACTYLGYRGLRIYGRRQERESGAYVAIPTNADP